MKSMIGIDIAKKDFASSLVNQKGQNRRKKGVNTAAGIESYANWVKQNTEGEVHICMESTSVYWEELALALHEKGYIVSVVNPARIKGYAISQLKRSKTDPIDADTIAHFCRTQEPEAWQPPTEAERKLRSAVRHLAALNKDRTRQLNRLESSRDKDTIASIHKLIALLEAEITETKQRIDDIFDDHPDLKNKRDLLVSIQGIGETTATIILAEMYDIQNYKDAKAVAADAGVTTSEYSSGTSVRRKPRMSRMGKASIRSALYLPALTAKKWNKHVKELAERLEARGKVKMQIVVAAMRKLLHIAYGVLKSGKPYDPEYADSRTR